MNLLKNIKKIFSLLMLLLFISCSSFKIKEIPSVSVEKKTEKHECLNIQYYNHYFLIDSLFKEIENRRRENHLLRIEIDHLKNENKKMKILVELQRISLKLKNE